MTNILVVGPHPDDQEIGMGGTIARFVEQGHDILLLDITNGEPTPFGDPETRAEEAQRAAEILGVQRKSLGFPNRFVQPTLELRHAIASVIREHQAQIIFTVYFEDAHPDHVAVAQATADARFAARLTKVDEDWAQTGEPINPKWLFYYYAMHLRKVHNPSFLIDTTGYEQRKHDSIEAYHTQFVLPEKNRQILEAIDGMGLYFGSRLGTKSAEPFFTHEPIGLSDLSGLVM